MSMKRGVFQQPPQQQATTGTPQPIRARVVETKSRIVTSEPPPQPSRLITQTERREPAVRGLLVDGTGRPIRGLSQATIAAHTAHTETASEQCTNCGEMRTPAQMQTIINNAYNSNNPLRICQGCSALAYKNPHDASAQWRPAVPSVRFDRRTAAPFDARKQGMRISDLVTKDTYHNEREVEPQFRADTLQDEGRWSGGRHGGHQVTPESVAHSRERASRR